MNSLRTLLLTTVAVSAAGAAVADDNLKVVTSIKPLYSLATAITAGTETETTLLVKGAASPHTYSMAPSEARALQQADVVFWIGPALEHFLDKPLEALGGNAKVVELEDAPGVETLEPRAGGAFDAHDHDHEGDVHDDHDADQDHDAHADHDHDEHADAEHEHAEADHHHDGEVDPHMWLDPFNAKAFAAAMAQTLAENDQANAAIYADNAEKLEARLDDLAAGIQAQIDSVSKEPYVVFHDAYHYFGHRFDVEAAGSITVNPEAPPSAQRIREIHDKLTELGAACVFSEPQFPPKIIDAVIEGTDARTGVLDPLGAGLEDGPDLYFVLLENLAGNLTDCFVAE
ncbi:zinc ABC transporter substrate-binding protein [Martelella lutilitoris]|uniref:High-affinity zinc uptake system protein ZnuA n=1 Tax=Martelella lutilitoris TaxID=2583532 RepID=A0A5C4JS63_9HYPH|nr:zinc ABC transporter substrate-binding protein [Martelella lutilitoris]TNB48021.1 zinc ABC transporter substrate-binding protein [Martelella lutilitoris]